MPAGGGFESPANRLRVLHAGGHVASGGSVVDTQPVKNSAFTRRKGPCDMPTRANPMESRLVNRPSQVERKVMCTRYQDCLDEAIRQNWVSFSCRKCRAYQPLELDQTEWLADSLACLALMYVAELHQQFKQKPRGGIVLRLQRLRSRQCLLGPG